MSKYNDLKGGITNANLSILKNNKPKVMTFSTLEVICGEVHYQQGDLLEYKKF